MQNSKFPTWIAVSFLVGCVACAPRATADDSEDQTGKVFSSIADLAVERNAVLHRFAMLVTGERHVIGKSGGPEIRPFYAIRIGSKKKAFNYIAHCDYQIGARWNKPYDTQIWIEKCVSKGRLKIARGPINNPKVRYQSPPPGMNNATFLKEKNFEIFHIDPFDDPMLVATHLISLGDDTAKVEKLFLDDATFLSSNRTLGNNIISKWNVKWPSLDVNIEVTHGAGSGFFPVQVVYEEAGNERDEADFFSHARIKWKKHNKQRVVNKIEAASVTWIRGKPIKSHWHLKFQWLIGDEVSDEFIDFYSPDMREPIREHFAVDFDRKAEGEFIRSPPWVTPEDLYISADIK